MRVLGSEVESLVRDFLLAQGLQFVASNYRCKNGEVDLIMRDKDTMVFVEVRYRQHDTHGDGIATVNKSKQYRIKRTAAFYLKKHNLYDRVGCRFDIRPVAE